MGLFGDDFYSTKVSKRSQREMNHSNRVQSNGGWGRGGSGGMNRRTFRTIIFSVASSMLFTVLLVWIFNGSDANGIVDKTAPGGGKESVVKQPFDFNERVIAATDKVRPAVVSVISVFMEDKDKARGVGIGSGVIFQKVGDKARIVTNNHVVENGSSFEVVLSDSSRKKAVLIGGDTYSDLAVLEIDAADVKVIAEFGDSDKLKYGETAIAIGNALGLGFSQTTTQGVISSPLRTIPVYLGKDGEMEWELDLIQTDAAINQGNSGGALVSLEGKVIGINSMKLASTGVEGLGFAIPINQAKPILDLLIKDHKIKRPYMGVTTENLQSFKSGLEVLKLPESVKTGVIVNEVHNPAKDAGLRTNDVIVELDGKAVNSSIELRKYLYNAKKIGDKMSVTYYRGGKKTTGNITLGEFAG